MNNGEVSFSLNGKVIVVTGGTGILGHAFVNALAQAGARVGILGRNEARANSRAEEICARGGEALPLIADVLDEPQLLAAANRMRERYGRIDGLVNAAGGNVPEAVLQPEEDIFSFRTEGMRKALDLNLWGTVIPTLVFGKIMAEEDGGSIVNISSVSSTRALTKVLGYSMGKAAVESFNKWFGVELARRYGDKIRMNALVPGFFITEQNRSLLITPEGQLTERGQSVLRQTPFHRFGVPEELSGALIWLLSDAASFVTGASIVVDGGFTAFSGV